MKHNSALILCIHRAVLSEQTNSNDDGRQLLAQTGSSAFLLLVLRSSAYTIQQLVGKVQKAGFGKSQDLLTLRMV